MIQSAVKSALAAALLVAGPAAIAQTTETPAPTAAKTPAPHAAKTKHVHRVVTKHHTKTTG